MNTSATSSHNVTSTSPGDWKYVSEGGATIVFSYCGPPDPVFTGTVLRLRKVSRNLNKDVGLHSDSGSAAFEGEEEEPDDPSISFQQKVISQLIPACAQAVSNTCLAERRLRQQNQYLVDVSPEWVACEGHLWEFQYCFRYVFSFKAQIYCPGLWTGL